MARKLRVAFQGERGAYSEDAIAAYFSRRAEARPYAEFSEVFEAVERGEATHGMVPVENSIEGTVAPVNDLLMEHDLQVTGETLVPIHHCLIANPSTEFARIRTIYSHPQALAQCRKFLSQYPRWRSIPVYDTAGSVKLVGERGRKDEAAIASRRAAEIYGMKVLREGIQSDLHNYTRFFVLERHPSGVRGANKTSIVFSVKNVPGSVHRCLGEFASRGINLTKLESRPRRTRPWNYVFFADFDGSVDEPRCSEAIGALLRVAGFVKILGSYRRAEHPRLR